MRLLKMTDLTEEQAANMRFVPEGEEPHSLPLLSTDPMLTISNRVKEIADLVEKQPIERCCECQKECYNYTHYAERVFMASKLFIIPYLF